MSLMTPVKRYKNGAWEYFADNVSREVPISFEWEYSHSGISGGATLWAWPGPDEAALKELVLGHTLTDLLSAATGDPCIGQGVTGEVVGEAASGYRVALLPASQRTVASGLVCPAPERILERMDSVIAAPGKWDGTGCFHRAGFFLPSAWGASPILHVVEDIGRHNCLDRLAGYAAYHGVPLSTLFVTARITASLYHKAWRMGVREIVSRSAVTLNAVNEAQREGVGLIGFCRPKEARFTVFAEGRGAFEGIDS